MKWSDQDIRDRMMRTKPIWHRQLVQIARKKAERLQYVADIACGSTGLLSRLFKGRIEPSSRTILGIGIDRDLAVVKQAQLQAVDSNLPLYYMRADMQDLSSMSALTFDVVFCWETFYLLTNAELQSALKWIKRILNSDGIFICGALGPRTRPDPVVDPYCEAAEKKIRPNRATWRTVDEYLCLLRQSGFEIEYKRIFVSESLYLRNIAGLPPKEMLFQSETHMHEYYTKVGKSVWICSLSKPPKAQPHERSS